MNIVNFNKKKDKSLNDAIDGAIENLKTSTHFIIAFSDDNLSSVYYYDYDVNKIEAIGMLDLVKNSYLNKSLYGDPDDDEGMNIHEHTR